MEREFGIDGGPLWVAIILIIFALTCLAVYVAVRRNNATVAMALTGISSCLVSPFSWFHHWVWVAPLLLAILLGVNEFIGKHLRGVIGAQVAGLASFITMIIFALPYVAIVVWDGTSYQRLDDINTLGALAFTGTGVIFIALYGLLGLLGLFHQRKQRI